MSEDDGGSVAARGREDQRCSAADGSHDGRGGVGSFVEDVGSGMRLALCWCGLSISDGMNCIWIKYNEQSDEGSEDRDDEGEG